MIGQDGVIGLKSGFTDPAACCLVTAARRKVGNRIVLVVSATLGQPWSLAQAGTVDLQLLDAATADLSVHTVLRAHQAVASLSAGWSHKRLEAVLWSPVTVVGWPGLIVKTVVKASVPRQARPRPRLVGGHESGNGGGVDARGDPAGRSGAAERLPAVGACGLDGRREQHHQFHRGSGRQLIGRRASAGPGLLGQSRSGL